MATYEELMAAAGRADKAGDEGAARKLVQEALRVKGAAPDPASDPTGGLITPTLDENENWTDMTGLGPRPDRFGDTIKKATAGPLAATTAYGMGAAGTGPSPTLAQLPEGMPLRQPVAVVGDAAMTALSALGVGYAGVAGTLGEMFGGSPTGENQLARDLMLAGQVAIPELAGVSSTARIAGRTAGAAETLAATPTVKQTAARAASDLGITPSLGMTGKGGAMIAAAMEKLPLSAQIVARDAARAVEQIEGAFKTIGAKIGKATSAYAAGERLQTGLNAYVDRFKTRSGQLYDAVEAAIPPTTRMQLPTTQATIAETKAFFAQNPELAKKLGLNDWDAVMAEAGASGISFQAARQFRSKIGEAIGSNRGALADESIGRLKGLYASLTADMEAAAKAAGPDAYKAWTTATAHYKAGATRIDTYLDRAISAENPERAFEAFAAMTRADRASSDVKRMREIKASLGKDEWGDVSASIVDRLGKATPGQQSAAGDVFSASTFLTEWNRMAPEAKALLLPADVRNELEQLAAVAARAKAAGLERNTSNTGTVAAQLVIGGGLATAPGTTIATIALNTLSAKALTSSLFLNAVNKAARGDTRALNYMARGNGPFATDAKTILRLSAAEAAVGNNAANSSAAPAAAAMR